MYATFRPWLFAISRLGPIRPVGCKRSWPKRARDRSANSYQTVNLTQNGRCCSQELPTPEKCSLPGSEHARIGTILLHRDSSRLQIATPSGTYIESIAMSFQFWTRTPVATRQVGHWAAAIRIYPRPLETARLLSLRFCRP